jgi:hypothetical protein
MDDATIATIKASNGFAKRRHLFNDYSHQYHFCGPTYYNKSDKYLGINIKNGLHKN